MFTRVNLKCAHQVRPPPSSRSAPGLVQIGGVQPAVLAAVVGRGVTRFGAVSQDRPGAALLSAEGLSALVRARHRQTRERYRPLAP